MKKFVIACLFLLALVPAQNIEQAWEVAWARFYLPQVRTFGDYLSSYEKGKKQAHLPTAAEVRRQFPNPCGYSTGMEDGAILGGAMLSVLYDRFEATKDETLRAKAAQVFAGLRSCVTAARDDFERGEVRRPRQCRKLL